MTASLKIETNHSDMIHDAQLDYYGRRLATASSDRTVRIFDIDGENQRLVTTLTGHEGPIHSLSWAHPSFGVILASCSFDGKVFIWKEEDSQGGQKQWIKIKEHLLHTASVNDVSWAPHELGAILACASSDGKISVLTFNNDGTWDASLFPAHPLGVTSLSWSPALGIASLTSSPTSQTGIAQVKRFASGGCDGIVRVWGWREARGWVLEGSEGGVSGILEGHTDWIRDVAWAPSAGLGRSYIASGGQDKTVLIWTQESSSSPWVKTALKQSDGSEKFKDVVWGVSWSVGGNVLAVSSGDGKVSLWKENLKGIFEEVTNMSS